MKIGSAKISSHKVRVTFMKFLTHSVLSSLGYLYPYGESVGDKLLPYDSSDPVREMTVQDPFQYFDKDVKKIFVCQEADKS